MRRLMLGFLLASLGVLTLAIAAWAQGPQAPPTACEAQVQIMALARQNTEATLGQITAANLKEISDLRTQAASDKAEIERLKKLVPVKAEEPKK